MAVNNTPLKKIHIIGAPGSGKTYLSRKLAWTLGIELHDLDDAVWANESGTYGVKRPEPVRDQKLASILAKPSWIVEGVYYSWLDASFQDADMIVIINPPRMKRNYYLISRFIKRKIGLKPSKNETLKSLKDIILWGNEYSQKTIPVILDMTEAYSAKRYMFHNADDAYQFICTQSGNRK